jgi:hypothetical protein
LAKAGNATQQLRIQAESARTDFEQSRNKAHSVEAESKAKARFDVALAQSVDAQNRFDRGDFIGAASQFQAASKGMLQASEEAANATQEAQQRAAMDAARTEMENVKRGFAGTDAAASGEEARARQLAQEGKFVEATAAYQRATPLWRDAISRDAQRKDAAQAAQKDENERQSIRALLDRYRSAYEAKDMMTIRAVFPTISTAEENSTRNNFAISRSIQMLLDVNPNDIHVTGESIRVPARQRFEIRTTDNQTVRSEASILFNLRKNNGSWLIQSIVRQ